MTSHLSTALVIGKFWPPHAGHHALIRFAEQQSHRLVIVVCATKDQRPTGLDRALWMQQVHPTAEVVVVDDFCAWHHPKPCPDECSEKWAKRVRELRIGQVDTVVTSEDYGPRFADALGSTHLAYDTERHHHQISATAIRHSLSEHWPNLHPAIRAGLHRRVVVLGAESTGTTTLAADLAGRLQAPLVAEVGRTYSWALFAETNEMTDVQWSARQFWQIVDHQINAEATAVHTHIDRIPGSLGPWLVCDTDTLATVAWWERYLNSPSNAVEDLANARPADLYLLTSPRGVDFDDSDPLRDGRAIRSAMHERFIELLSKSGRPFRVVEGTRQERSEFALAEVERHEACTPRFIHG